jgi:hypothetical protein
MSARRCCVFFGSHIGEKVSGIGMLVSRSLEKIGVRCVRLPRSDGEGTYPSFASSANDFMFDLGFELF